MTDLFPIYEESFVIISQKIFKILENNYSHTGGKITLRQIQEIVISRKPRTI